jgi:TolC family type I secretion outer membrane protein
MRRYPFWLTVVLLTLMALFPLTRNMPEVSAAESVEKGRMPVDWNAVENLDLATAVKIALADNPGLAASAARVEQARARVAQARAAYWPRLDANAGGARVKISDNAYTQNPAAAVENPENYYSADLTATWTLFDGFQRKFSSLAARYGEKSSSAALADARRLMISAVALSFFSAQLALENIAIAKADEAFNQRQLADARARQRVGTGSLSDVLNFQVRKNQAKTTRINQENQYEIALYGLAALLGLPEARLPEHVRLAALATETEAELAPPPADELVTNAMERRPDIQQVRWGLKQTEAQIKVAQSDYYPAIVLSGSLEGERAEDPGFESEDFGNRVQVGLSYNLFAGGATRARVRETRHRQEELEKQMEELVLAATAEIRSSAALVTTAQDQVMLQRENVDLVERTRDLVEKEYNAGQGSLVRLNEAQRDLTTARSNLALALVGLRQAWVELETNTGMIAAAYAVDPAP